MTIGKKLDVIHTWIISNVWAQFFTAFTRVLLAIGFIPPSLKKILNLPFTVLPDSHPVGNYFNALYQTGFYYQFIGWGQLFAALLLLFPRTAHLGALAFFPIILNIAVLTNSVDFAGTKYITLLMLLASTYLLAWDYDCLKILFFRERIRQPTLPKLGFFWLPALFAVGGAILATLAATFGVSDNNRSFLPLLFVLAAGGFIFGLVCAAHQRFMKIGRAENSINSA